MEIAFAFLLFAPKPKCGLFFRASTCSAVRQIRTSGWLNKNNPTANFMNIQHAEIERAKRYYIWSFSSWLEEIKSDFSTLSSMPNPVILSHVDFFRSVDEDFLRFYGKAFGKYVNPIGAHFAGEDELSDQEKHIIELRARGKLFEITKYYSHFDSLKRMRPNEVFVEVKKRIEMLSPLTEDKLGANNSMFTFQIKGTGWLLDMTADAASREHGTCHFNCRMRREGYNGVKCEDPLLKYKELGDPNSFSGRNFALAGWLPAMSVQCAWYFTESYSQYHLERFSDILQNLIREMKTVLAF